MSAGAPAAAVAGTPAASRVRGVAALALAGFLWGSTFLVVQDATDDAAVAPFLALRFLIGGVVLWPLARRRPATTGEIRHGMVAGLSLCFGHVFQTWGLRYVASASSAFITYLLVVIVPIITVVRTRRRPPTHILVGIVIALTGLALLSGGTGGLGKGELLTMAGAVAFAVHLIVVGEHTACHDPIRFTMWQVLTVSALCAIPGVFSPGGYAFGGDVWFAAAFCGVAATAIAFWAMTYGQRVVAESQAALILLLEPVSAGILGLATGEALGAAGVLGAVLILIAVTIAELGGPRPPAVGGELPAAGEFPAG